jgi:hypothetical protein
VDLKFQRLPIRVGSRRYALYSFFEIDDHAFARAARVGDAVTPVPQSLLRDLDGERNRFCAACVDDRDDVFVPLTHGSLIDSYLYQ